MSRSIRGRFLLVSLVTVVLALSLAGIAFVELFTRTFEKRIDEELADHGTNIAGGIRFSAEGSLTLPDRPVDARFNEPYGGLYWQIVDDRTSEQLRSPSLWDYTLPLPADSHETGEVHRYHLEGPEQSTVLVQERKVIVAAPDGQHPVRIAVGIDVAAVAKARSSFATDLFPYMVALAAFLIAASLVQLIIGLRPLSSVSEGLNRVRERRAERLTGQYPAELQEVVGAVNSLLDAQQLIIDKARSRAADLAHGLKTPLTILSNDAATLHDKGETQIADELAHLADVMRAHVDHELTRSRIAANAGLRRSDASPARCIDNIIRTLKRSPQGETLSWIARVPDDLTVPVDPNDLQEMLGNVLENAMKWARHEIIVEAETDDRAPRLRILDDGPGVPPEQIDAIMHRGVRLDMQTPGSGIGLSIVREIGEIYGIGVAIENRKTGGLSVTLTFGA
ncbi:HAMP domain-containing histidine kinase [Ciceribacter sp. L1K23]|uniref:sensor histidine kinase n=1 Tax=Ciceribacter sp. L1K23 TaxID=2820276 RepID=UPI001B825F69|nr:HAMP domain-containing sensor histidine kinase [Ciceribacter sp. L1K23]MBR0554722.1 HAMP domain-containing histidine kinase [Ciceribacter sp. L1K23]